MKISAVIPVYNSGKILNGTYSNIDNELKKITDKYEILFRDDGSKDNSKDILNKLSKKKNVRVFFNEENKGLGYTLKNLFKDSIGEYIIYFDADAYLCFDLSLLNNFISKMNHNDVVIASRYERKNRDIPFSRVYPSRIYNMINKILFGLDIEDIGSGFVIFKKKALDNINLESNKFDIHVELFAKLKKAGYKMEEIPVKYSHWYGGSFNVFKHGPKTLLNTFRVWYRLRK
ncbi:MAG: glycosyltransferase family 2 protein [Candidatus Woesearchaeota archaeon]